jgi:peptide deformylase
VPPRAVLEVPDPRLKQVCDGVDPGSFGRAARVAVDLVDTMRSHPRCVGLAAPQIGELVRIVAIDVTGHPKATSCAGLVVLVNPVVVRTEGEERGREGCLSIPNLTGNVRRATAVRVEAVAPDGRPVAIEAEGFEARVVLHELDHLDGILFLDRVDSRRDVFRRRSYG